MVLAPASPHFAYPTHSPALSVNEALNKIKELAQGDAHELLHHLKAVRLFWNNCLERTWLCAFTIT